MCRLLSKDDKTGPRYFLPKTEQKPEGREKNLSPNFRVEHQVAASKLNKSFDNSEPQALYKRIDENTKPHETFTETSIYGMRKNKEEQNICKNIHQTGRTQ